MVTKFIWVDNSCANHTKYEYGKEFEEIFNNELNEEQRKTAKIIHIRHAEFMIWYEDDGKWP